MSRRSTIHRLASWLAFFPLVLSLGCNYQLPVALPTRSVISTTPASAPAAADETAARTESGEGLDEPSSVTPIPIPPDAVVTFSVRTPAGTPSGEAVVLTVLDEVTGLAFNTEVYPMEAEAVNGGSGPVYHQSIRLAFGSTVKYRYERQAVGATVVEHTTQGDPVRYRLYHVEGNGTVEDTVSAWTDVPASGPTGRISGLATDRATGQPLANLLATAGGQQTLTKSDGSFMLEDLPPGVHNLIVYALDGAQYTFQQGALVAANATTPAPIQLTPAPIVNVAFLVELPADTPSAAPVRFASNLYQLGNTFSTLSGGVSGLAANMPSLVLQPDGRYSVTLSLPVGADIRYKYTLGDGFWNAEHTHQGAFRLRQIIVPAEDAVIEERVETWSDGGPSAGGPLQLDVTVPENTPAGDFVSLQLNPFFGWTEPLPMWSLAQNRWGYTLFSPLKLPGLAYRYCRNSQCGPAGELDPAGRPVDLSAGAQTLTDEVAAWAQLDPAAGTFGPYTDEVSPRANFTAGVEFQASYHPSWKARLPGALDDVTALGGNALFLSPTWTWDRTALPLIEPVPGRDPLWFDLLDGIQQARARKLAVALFPQPNFPVESSGQWWQESRRDFAWWLVWFEQYRSFILHHADLATRADAQALILGGDWLSPALPNGMLASGEPSGVPVDAEMRWRDLIAEVRNRFNGSLLWAVPLPDLAAVPAFLDALDGVYVLWSAPLITPAGDGAAEMAAEAARLLDEQVYPLKLALNKTVVIAAEYPSVEGAGLGCIPTSLNSACVEAAGLSQEMADRLSLGLDLQGQADLYAALLSVVDGRAWIDGFTTRGYYPPAAVQDKTASIHGKPAEALLAYWYPRLVAIPGP